MPALHRQNQAGFLLLSDSVTGNNKVMNDPSTVIPAQSSETIICRAQTDKDTHIHTIQEVNNLLHIIWYSCGHCEQYGLR